MPFTTARTDRAGGGEPGLQAAGKSLGWWQWSCFIFLFHLGFGAVAIDVTAARHPGCVHCHALPGRERQHHVAGGIAIAIGAMVDAAVVVMIENAHKHLEHWSHNHPDQKLVGDARWRVIGESAAGSRPCAVLLAAHHHAVLHSGVHAGSAWEGRLFSPLAFTKTYMAAAAALSVTLIPVLMGYLIRGRIPDEVQPTESLPDCDLPPAERGAGLAQGHALAVACAICWARASGLCSIGGEFMPRLDEGDLLMPSRAAGLSRGKLASCCSRQTGLSRRCRGAERIRKGRPCRNRHRPAPWKCSRPPSSSSLKTNGGPGMTQDKLVDELDHIVKVQAWPTSGVPPIRNRIDMLATGIKSGVKWPEPTWPPSTALTGEIEKALKDVPGVSSALAERLTGGVMWMNINRDAASALG